MTPADPRPARVAIIGAGPKGVQALERLLDHARRLPGHGLEVDLLDPASVPGAGPHYDPAQHDYLRMNLAAGHVDMWWPDGGVVPAAERLAFPEWSRRAGAAVPAGEYPPRALVGRYLAEGLERLVRHVPAQATVRVRRVRVRGVRRGADGWLVDADIRCAPYDEVLIATGHAAATARRDRPPGATVPAVFPVGRWLTRRRVPPGSRVGVRGFALTFIDAALALTEGRGGRFAGRGDDGVPVYVPATGEPAVMLPFSRTGAPMLAKPVPGVPIADERIARVTRPWIARLLGLTPPVQVERDLKPLLAGAARALLAEAGGRSSRGRATPPPADDPEEALRRSLAVATGRAGPDEPWARGQAWRTLYPALVKRLGHGGLAAGGWGAFRHLAADMERVAFGPPPQNVAKLLALVDAGMVDLTHVRGGRTEPGTGGGVLRSAAGEDPVDVTIDAVLPAPGVTPGDRLLGPLVEAGLARVPEGRRGLDVDREARCLDAHGRPTPGLSAIGRPTEDTVIGNDTLSRHLHDLPERWAARIVDERLRAPTRASRRRLALPIG
jgi:diaminopimelate decarboxylase